VTRQGAGITREKRCCKTGFIGSPEHRDGQIKLWARKERSQYRSASLTTLSIRLRGARWLHCYAFCNRDYDFGESVCRSDGVLQKCARVCVDTSRLLTECG
jgi:hypothetical protein